MESQRLSLWVQLVTGAAVLVGLGLVIWELKQTRELAAGQRVHDSYSLLIEDARAIMGETFGEVIAKGCIDPQSLSDGEIVQLREYYNGGLYLIRRMKGLEEEAAFEIAWEDVARSYVKHGLDSKVGRLHYQERAEAGLEPEIQRIAAEFLETDLEKPCGDLATFVEKVRSPG